MHRLVFFPPGFVATASPLAYVHFVRALRGSAALRAGRKKSCADSSSGARFGNPGTVSPLVFFPPGFASIIQL
jgi:hypothetical protein